MAAAYDHRRQGPGVDAGLSGRAPAPAAAFSFEARTGDSSSGPEMIGIPNIVKRYGSFTAWTDNPRRRSGRIHGFRTERAGKRRRFA